MEMLIAFFAVLFTSVVTHSRWTRHSLLYKMLFFVKYNNHRIFSIGCSAKCATNSQISFVGIAPPQ